MAAAVASRASSRPPSVRTASTPAVRRGASASAADLPSQSSHNPFSHLLRHIFDSPRHATFAVFVTVHELSNVPQLNGSFAVRWKFRGHRPHDADKLLEHPQPRKPPVDKQGNNGQAHSLRPSASAMSLRAAASAASSGTSTPSPLYHTHTPRRLQSDHELRHKSSYNSLPQSVVSRDAMDAQPLLSYPSEAAKLQELARKQVSDPLPRKGSEPPPSIVESPVASNAGLDDDDFSSRTQSTYSMQSTLSVPAAGSRTPSYRQGTAPPTFGASGPGSGRPRSVASVRSGLDRPLTPITGSSTESKPLNFQPGWPDPDSDQRKGAIPMQPIRAHRVNWEYKLQHVVRVMLSKPGALSNGRVPAPQQQLLTLGEGPLSDSGLKLEVQEMGNDGVGHRVFGFVNIDLAPFAGLGPTARKFLLTNSKTNATIRITIDMRFIGGETDWIAPPLSEGHLVTGLSELTGTEDTGYPELQLLPTRSCSSDSVHSSNSRPSNRSGNSQVSLNKQASTVSQVQQATKPRYRTYEHHLRPDAKRPHEQHRRATGSTSTSGGVGARPMLDTEHLVASPNTLIHDISRTDSPQELDAPNHESYFHMRRLSIQTVNFPGPVPAGESCEDPTSSLVSNFSPLSPQTTLSPLSPSVALDSSTGSRTSPVTMFQHSPPRTLTGRHTHHSAYLRDGRRSISDDLHPDLVVEHVFNPIAGEELSPFTFIPDMVVEATTTEGDSSDAASAPVEINDAAVAAKADRRWHKLKRRVMSNPHRGVMA